MKKRIHPNRIFPLVSAVAVFIVCFCVLYLGENVGLSDNGDFRRVLLVNNLKYEDETDYYYLFKEHYTMEIQGDSFSEKAASLWQTTNEEEIYSSPHFLLIKISKVLNYLSNCISGRPEGAYDIGWLAFLYISMFSIAAWVLFTFFADKSMRLQITVVALFLFIFCDSGYILYFNSFYGEPLQYVAVMMLISAGVMIYRRPSLPKVIFFFVALYFFAGAKLANIPYSIIVSLLALNFIILRKNRLFRAGVVVSALVSVLLMVQMYTSIPDWMQNDTTYQSVFFGITKESDNPEKDLKQLGVDAKYLPLVNTHAYLEEYPVDRDTPEFQQEFYDRVSKLDIAGFYLLHPVRLFQKMSIAIEHSAYIRPPNLGNSSERAMELTNRYSGWSKLRVSLKFLYQPVFVLTLLLLMTAYVIFVDIYLVVRRKEEDPRRLYMVSGVNVLMLGLWLNLILPIIGNGEADLAKHLFLFVNCMDLLFAFIVLHIFTLPKVKSILSFAGLLALCGVFYISLANDTVYFGTYQGKPVEWEVAAEYNDGTCILVTKECIAEMPFDQDSNVWEDSDLRKWLNTEFIREFSAEEKRRIVTNTNEILLPFEDKDRAIAGDHPHYWDFTKKYVDDLAKTAYHYYLEDQVYIPTLDILENLNERQSYWVLCPYTNNNTMERYMNYDGFVLHTSIDNERGVRAAVRYREKG